MPVTQALPEVAGANFASLGANWRLQFIQPDGLPLTMAGLEVIDFGAISYKEIFQNVKTILATPLFSAALERTLGLDNTIVDRPINDAAAITVAILQAVTQWEPRCKVMNIDFEGDPINGHLVVLLRLDIKNVIYGTNQPYTAKAIPATPVSLAYSPDVQTWQQTEPRVQIIYQPIPVPVPVAGPEGPKGERGSLWFTGAGAPTTMVGANLQDLYLDESTGDVYQFDGTTWRKRV